MSFKKRKSPVDIAIQWQVRLESPSCTDSQRSEFFLWLNSSPENQLAYIEAERLSLTGKELALQKKRTHTNNVSHFYRWQTLLPTCAAFIVLVAFVYLQIKPVDPTLIYHSTGIGEQKDIHLQDGSLIKMNTNSALELISTNGKVEIQLSKGEALFQVTPNKNRTFTVITDNGTARVLGTVFSVKSLSEDALVTVIEGKVALTSSAKPQNNLIHDNLTVLEVLTPNQQLSFSAAKKGLAPSEIDAKSVLSWRNARLIFRGEPLVHVIRELSRYYHSKIIIDDPELDKMKVLAIINLNDDAQHAALSLASALGLEADISNKGVITISRQKF